VSPEQKIRECIELKKSHGFIVSNSIWFQWRDGKNPPKVSPWGAVSMFLNSDSHGNYIFPQVKMWDQVVNYLEVDDEWLKMFTKGFDGEAVSPMWLTQTSSSGLNAFQLGRKFATEYLIS
jgi:hypothetical protein